MGPYSPYRADRIAVEWGCGRACTSDRRTSRYYIYVVGHIVEHADALLRDCPKVPKLLPMPGAVSERLDRLVAVARKTSIGRSTSRNEVAAALVVAMDTTDDALTTLLQGYLGATVADALQGFTTDVPESGIVELPTHGPGRRRAGSGSP
jgi:hypothetical protein